MENKLNINLASIMMEIRSDSAKLKSFFTDYLSLHSEKNAVSEVAKLDDYDRKIMSESFSDQIDKAIAEFNMFVYPVTDILTRYDRLLFHGVSFLWKEKAFILIGPSGVGKTTQFLNWKSLYPNEISILNGDKPILECREGKTIICHPSPWNGKEGYGSMRKAPLAGMILLEQSTTNCIQQMKNEDVVSPILRESLSFLKTKSAAHQYCKLVEQLIMTVPVWKLSNDGTLKSSQLAYDTLKAFFVI